MEHKNRRLSIKLTQQDWDAIHHKADRAHKNLTDYVTSTCLGKDIVVIEGIKELLQAQKAIGRNINQLTTLANMGRIQVIGLQECTAQLAQSNRELQKILQRKRWNHGDNEL